MTAPRRIQRRRTKGWRMPEGAVYVGRGSKWGNPYRPAFVDGQWVAVDDNGVEYVGYGPLAPWGGWPTRTGAIRECVRLFSTVEVAYGLLADRADVSELRGRDLACWCPLDAPCHGDVLLDLANPHEWGANPGDGCVRCAGLPGDGPCEVTP